MYKVLDKTTEERFAFATLSEAKAHAAKWQAAEPEKEFTVLSDGICIWSAKEGDNANIFTI